MCHVELHCLHFLLEYLCFLLAIAAVVCYSWSVLAPPRERRLRKGMVPLRRSHRSERLSFVFNRNGFGLTGIFHWIYVLLIAIGTPMATAFALNRNALENKQDRLFMTAVLMSTVYATISTSRWNFHYRQTHANSG